jgi:putative aldouronate transport system substrate-binding protein
VEANNGFNPAWAHITDNCKDPVLAFRWLEGMYSDEATMTLQLGVKGKMRDDPDPGAVGINQKPAIWKVIETPDLVENPYYVPMFLGNRYSDLRLGQQADWDNPNTPFEQEPKLYRETLEKYYPYRPAPGELFPLNLNHTAVEATEAGRLSNQINTYVQESIVAFISGNKSLDRDWAAYVAEFKRLELPQYLQLKQVAYDRQYGKK